MLIACVDSAVAAGARLMISSVLSTIVHSKVGRYVIDPP